MPSSPPKARGHLPAPIQQRLRDPGAAERKQRRVQDASLHLIHCRCLLEHLCGRGGAGAAPWVARNPDSMAERSTDLTAIPAASVLAGSSLSVYEGRWEPQHEWLCLCPPNPQPCGGPSFGTLGTPGASSAAGLGCSKTTMALLRSRPAVFLVFPGNLAMLEAAVPGAGTFSSRPCSCLPVCSQGCARLLQIHLFLLIRDNLCPVTYLSPSIFCLPVEWVGTKASLNVVNVSGCTYIYF